MTNRGYKNFFIVNFFLRLTVKIFQFLHLTAKFWSFYGEPSFLTEILLLVMKPPLSQVALNFCGCFTIRKKEAYTTNFLHCRNCTM